MGTFAKILYNGFWDRPLAFVVRHRYIQFYFSREFDEQADEYEDAYKVFVLPNIPDDEINTLWGHLSQKTTQYLGQVPVRNIVFDSSFRKSIDTDILNDLIEKMEAAS